MCCVSPVGRAVESGLLLIGIIIIIKLLRNFGIKIGFKMGVLGCKSDNPHPSRVESIDKRFDLDTASAINEERRVWGLQNTTNY